MSKRKEKNHLLIWFCQWDNSDKYPVVFQVVCMSLSVYTHTCVCIYLNDNEFWLHTLFCTRFSLTNVSIECSFLMTSHHSPAAGIVLWLSESPEESLKVTGLLGSPWRLWWRWCLLSYLMDNQVLIFNQLHAVGVLGYFCHYKSIRDIIAIVKYL